MSILKKRVKQAKDMFPLAELCCNTNGDYLRKKGGELLDDLMLDTLNIMDYDNRGLEYGKELFKSKLLEMKTKIKKQITHAEFI